MKLRALAVNQFKKFTSHTKLEGIEDGLNVVVGPNEMGKSTLLDALRAVLFEKYDSKAKSIRELQNERNKAGPVVKLTFELENGLYGISKRFLKRPYARLECPDGRILEGSAAEDELRALLCFGKPGSGGAGPENLGMWNVLWVKQGGSFGAPDLPESARGNLHGALESEVGTVLGGKRGRALPQAVENRLRELVSQTGKSRGEYKIAAERTDDLNNELEELKEQKRGLSDTLNDLEEEQKKLKRLSDAGRNEEDKAELERVRRRRNELVELESQVEIEERELEVLKLRLEQAEQKEKQRYNLKKDVIQEESTLGELREKHKETREREEQARTDIERLKTEEREAEMTGEKADDAVLMKSRILAAVELKTLTGRLNAQLEKASDAERRKLEAENRVAAITVTEEMIGRIEAAEKEVEKVANRLSATSTLVTLEMENPSGIEVDGLPLTSKKDFLRVISPITITIPERGKITVEPALENRDQLFGQDRKAKNQLRNVLNEAGVSSVEEAQALYGDRQKASQEAEFARQEAELLAPSTDEYEAGAHSLDDYIKKHQQMLENEMAKLGLQKLPERQEAEAALRNAQDESETARDSLNNARTALNAQEKVLISFQNELDFTNARCEEGEKRRENLLAQLKKAEDECTEDRLREETKAVQKAVAYQEAKVAELCAKRSNDNTLEQIEARVNRLEKAAEDKRNKCHRLEVSISEKRTLVGVLEGVGLDENIAQKKRELERWEEERKRHEHEVQVLGLLLETLRNAEREAKKLYLSPVTDRMRPYLQLLFPGSDITIDEDLHITGVIREAGYEEPFPLLSMGTQEQIAVLVRLAFAEMLVEQGQPATVVLDDALVFSDDTRMNRMFDILNVASHKVQTLILTCREQLFEDVGGHLLSPQPGNPEELMSA